MYLKLKNLSLDPFVPRSFGIFPMIAINYNIVSNYHWDLSDASNCLCCLIPLGNFQGGDLYFPQLHVRVPLQPGQVVAFDSHNLLHDYTINVPKNKDQRHSPEELERGRKGESKILHFNE
ncbi:hypothetical protein Glove_465g2 [Diversispora epigaea]|uniref:TauD/TfdA-like domain-containing protein n=1 Tax=Diversispora epigaea TaxID=1348612 RepID=A0A397GP67_9GLOM|nr:hypothetical protein Glove_465g2 [Diversispora epigaea]